LAIRQSYGASPVEIDSMARQHLECPDSESDVCLACRESTRTGTERFLDPEGSGAGVMLATIKLQAAMRERGSR